MQSGPVSGHKSFQVIDAKVSRLDASPATPRRRWSTSAKEEIVAKAMMPGVNVSALARAHGLSPQQVFGWRRKALTDVKARTEDACIRRGGGRSRGDQKRRWHDRDHDRRGDAADRGGRRASADHRGRQGDPSGMIPAGARVFVATKPVDFRKGPASLMALVEASGADPFSGALYVFRAKRADRVKIVWWDGTGLCLFAKCLDERGFHWPTDRGRRDPPVGGAADGARRRHGLDAREGGARTPARWRSADLRRGDSGRGLIAGANRHGVIQSRHEPGRRSPR